MNICRNPECSNEYAEGTGHAIKMDGKEEFCSYKCMEEARRGGVPDDAMMNSLRDSIIDKLKEILPEGAEIMGGFVVRALQGSQESDGSAPKECMCSECVEDRKDTEDKRILCKKYYGGFIEELAGSVIRHTVQIRNSDMIKAGVVYGDLLVTVSLKDKESADSNRSFCRAQPNFKTQMVAKKGKYEVYVFSPITSVTDVLCYVMQDHLKEMHNGKESDEVLKPYREAIEAGLVSRSDSELWVRTAGEIIQNTAVDIFGPRAVGHRVSCEDMDVAMADAL